MILFRHADPRFAFLWEDESQPAGRWHGPGEGPAHYLAQTPDGAWAEFIRHEGITDPADLATVRRALWAIEVPDEPEQPGLPKKTMRGGLATYPKCQQAARRMRAGGATSLSAPSAALKPTSASGWRVAGGLTPGPARDERTVVLFGPRSDLIGWAACGVGQPRDDLLPRVNHLTVD